MAMFEQNNSQPCFADWLNKSYRLNRKKRSKEDVDEEEKLVSCLVKLARGEGNMITNNDRDISSGIPETKKRRVVEEEALQNVHKCSECGRVFETGQALGGHMSSHTHVLKKTKKHDIISATVCHKCSDCGKIFETGQALGGHMRKHYYRGDAAAKGSTSERGGDTTIVVRGDEGPIEPGVDAAAVVNDFDLNQPAPECFLCDDEQDLPFSCF